MTPFLSAALDAAALAGQLLRDNFGARLEVNAFEAHDIKLELDVRSQQLITDRLLGEFPDHALFGEEGIAGNQTSEYQWIVDPIDGTVNYFYGIPHFCISIALRRGPDILAGVIYDPMRNELWQAEEGSPTTLNGAPCTVSKRRELAHSMLSVGFSKSKTAIDGSLPVFEKMVYRARKCRMMGSAALDMAYVACGRLDAYIESIVSLWDIAAGIILIRNAGGTIDMNPLTGRMEKYSIVASSGTLQLNDESE
jgi:myo-inositol-1(or 4)-monophosphatase